MTRATKLVLATLILAGGYAGARMFPRGTLSTVEAPVLTDLRDARASQQEGRSPEGGTVAATGTSPATPDQGEQPRDLRPTYSNRVVPPPNDATAHSTSRVPAASPTPVPRRTHRIVDGDTLARLAERYLGDNNRAEEIFQLNRKLLPSPKILPIGVVLQLPPHNRPAVPDSTIAGPDRAAAPSLLPARPTVVEPHVSNDGDSKETDDLVPIPPGLFRRRTG
ncbi:MAG: LysM peptidoglycan-binding domain-containing protein [Pirellulales bacterium]